MATALIGAITAVPYNFVPLGWLPCNGQILPTTGLYQKLFAALGSRYGGDGLTTFGIPDLRGNTIIGAGTSTESDLHTEQGTQIGSSTLDVTTYCTLVFTVGVANLPNTPIGGPIDIGGLAATSTLYATTSIPGITSAPSPLAPFPDAMLSSSPSGAQAAAIYYDTTTTPSSTLAKIALGSDSIQTKTDGTGNFTSAPLGAGAPLMNTTVAKIVQVPVTQPSLGMTYIICFDGIVPGQDQLTVTHAVP